MCVSSIDGPILAIWLRSHAPGEGQMLLGTAGIFVFEQVVRKALQRAGLKLPSSLVSMVVAYLLLQVRCASRCSRPTTLRPVLVTALQVTNRLASARAHPSLIGCENGPCLVRLQSLTSQHE